MGTSPVLSSLALQCNLYGTILFSPPFSVRKWEETVERSTALFLMGIGLCKSGLKVIENGSLGRERYNTNTKPRLKIGGMV